MITHVVGSELAVSAERFWSEQLASSKGALPSGGAEAWPRSIAHESASLLAKTLRYTRTVDKTASGCKVVDEISIEARFRVLRPWLMAARLMKLHRLHSELRSRYGRAA